jgi:hypothetical protein
MTIATGRTAALKNHGKRHPAAEFEATLIALDLERLARGISSGWIPNSSKVPTHSSKKPRIAANPS